jgi:hypothetical protein
MLRRGKHGLNQALVEISIEAERHLSKHTSIGCPDQRIDIVQRVEVVRQCHLCIQSNGAIQNRGDGTECLDAGKQSWAHDEPQEKGCAARAQSRFVRERKKTEIPD